MKNEESNAYFIIRKTHHHFKSQGKKNYQLLLTEQCLLQTRLMCKSYAAVCLEGAVIALACIIFSVFSATPPSFDASAAAVTMVWGYVGELIFGMLVLTGTIKMADRVVHEMVGV